MANKVPDKRVSEGLNNKNNVASKKTHSNNNIGGMHINQLYQAPSDKSEKQVQNMKVNNNYLNNNNNMNIINNNNNHFGNNNNYGNNKVLDGHKDFMKNHNPYSKNIKSDNKEYINYLITQIGTIF